MGTGIMAAVPLLFEPYKSYGRQEKIKSEYFTKGFFENFNIDENESGISYVIKKDILFNNYKQFLLEFYDLIEMDFTNYTELDIDIIPKISNFDDFSEIFDKDKRNGLVPFIYYYYSTFQVLGCQCKKYWLFYSGSYKAYLEVYNTLLHFEKILSKAMKNPLANAVRFGIFR